LSGPRLEARHLEVLLAIDRAGSISGAARALDTEQPHVTRMLRRIEQHLGYPVFERGARGTRPTRAGMEVLERARQALDALAQLREPPRPTARSRTVRILCHGLNGAVLLDPLRRSHPEVEARLSMTQPDAAFRELEEGSADVFVGLRFPHGHWPRSPGVEETEILADPTVVFLPAAHRLAGKEELALHDLADEDWITGEDPRSRRMLQEECHRLGGFEPRLRYRTDDGPMVRMLLSTGAGVVLGSSVAPRGTGFVARPYRDATPARWMLTYGRDRVGRALVARLGDILRAHYADLRARAERDSPDRHEDDRGSGPVGAGEGAADELAPDS
jgi:DNA-binding transcriptional LysR family regulator